MEEQYKKTFDQMVDSLKMYQRYELKDKNRKDILDKVYVDPIENDGILNLCLKDNTTVLIGRRGTGKSTIFMRMQNELRKQNDIMTCYIDVKSIFDVAKRNYITINYLKTSNLEEIEQYSIQRQFILDFVDELINEICKNYDTIWEKFKQKLHISKSQKAIDKLKNIRKRIQDNNHLSNIEMQTLQEVMHSNVDNIIDKEKTIKTNIRTNQYTAVIFQKERNNPYTSHFYIAQELEPYLGSLELNFFISKYNEMSNKSGKKVSIYALNYGLCMDENLRWGKPKGNEYRTYFIESPFNFTPVIKNFLSENKKIYCENCMHEFSEEEYNLMKKYGGTCLKCGCKNSIQEKRVLSDEERSEIEEIEKKDNLLEREQYQLLKLLQYSRKDKTATELAQELDVSWQKIGWIAKKIEEDYCYLKKEPRKGKMYYVLSDLGREYLDSITP